MLDLLYADPKALPRLRKLPAFAAPLDGAPLALLDIDGLDGADEARVVRCLADETLADVKAIDAALLAGTHHAGRFLAPIVLVDGELAFAYDAVETLKLTVTTALPFAAGDDDLTAALKAAGDFLASPGAVQPRSVADSLSQRVRGAFTRAKRPVPAEYLEREVQRALVEQRRNRVALYAAAPHARALTTLAGERNPLLTFVPAAALDYLPLTSKFRCRALAEATPLVEEYESHPFALRIVALARVLTRP